MKFSTEMPLTVIGTATSVLLSTAVTVAVGWDVGDDVAAAVGAGVGTAVRVWADGKTCTVFWSEHNVLIRG